MGNGCIDYNKGKVSVIVPVYNVAKYLEECLNSIINQTYKNIEIIIVNDGSTDNSLDIIEIFKNKDNRIKVISQENKGISEARNIGLKNTVGEFILYVDSDDYLELNCIKEAVDKINNDCSEMVIFNYTRVYDCDVEGKSENVSLNLNTEKVYEGKDIAIMLLKNLTQGYVWNKLFRKRNLVENKFEFEKGRTIEDIYPIFKELINSKKVSYINKYNYNYRQRSNSAVHTFNKKAKDDYVHAIDIVSKYAKQSNIEDRIIEGYKLIKSCILIQDYYIDSVKPFYSEFKKRGYDKILPSLHKIKINKYNYKSIIIIILWKLRLYKIIQDQKKN